MEGYLTEENTLQNAEGIRLLRYSLKIPTALQLQRAEQAYANVEKLFLQNVTVSELQIAEQDWETYLVNGGKRSRFAGNRISLRGICTYTDAHYLSILWEYCRQRVGQAEERLRFAHVWDRTKQVILPLKAVVQKKISKSVYRGNPLFFLTEKGVHLETPDGEHILPLNFQNE